jgi:hypothetical protein
MKVRAAPIFAWTMSFIGFVFEMIVFRPGLMDGDSVSIMREAHDRFSDWFPPTVEAIWYLTDRFVAPGPLGFFILTNVLFWCGAAMLSSAVAKSGRPWISAALAAAFLFPLIPATLAYATKDTLLVAAWAAAVGCASVGLLRRRAVFSVGAIALVIFGVLVRYNAATGAWPLLLLAVPRPISIRSTAVSIAIAVGLFIVSPLLADLAFHAEQTHPLRSLVIFDLAGITARTGHNVFYDIPEIEPTEIKTCYSPSGWDVFAWGRCRHVDLDVAKRWPSEGALVQHWIAAVARHPAAYAIHRFDYATTLFDQRCAECTADFLWYGWAANPPSEMPTFSPSYAVFERVANAVYSVLGPITWIAVLVGGTIVGFFSRTAPLGQILFCICLSGIGYAAGYLILGVAAPARYLLWSLACAVMATPLAFGLVVLRVRVGCTV